MEIFVLCKTKTFISSSAQYFKLLSKTSFLPLDKITTQISSKLGSKEFPLFAIDDRLSYSEL